MKKIKNFFQWIIFVIIIPLFALLIVTGVVLHLTGVDVIGKTKHVAEYFNGSKETEKMQLALDETKTTLAAKSASEKKLQGEIKNKDTEIESYKKQIADIEGQLKESNDAKNAQNNLIQLYEKMAPEKAAAILTELSNTDQAQATKILKGIKPDKLAAILENMKPSVAAVLTKGITQ